MLKMRHGLTYNLLLLSIDLLWEILNVKNGLSNRSNAKRDRSLLDYLL